MNGVLRQFIQHPYSIFRQRGSESAVVIIWIR